MLRNLERASLLALIIGVVMAALAGPGLGSTTATTAKPTNFRVVVNGKYIPNSMLAPATDTYIPTATGRMKVGVQWTNNLSGSGYYVVVANLGTSDRRRCVSGTSCFVVGSKPLTSKQEVGWSVKIVLTKGNMVVSNKTVCLLGKG